MKEHISFVSIDIQLRATGRCDGMIEPKHRSLCNFDRCSG